MEVSGNQRPFVVGPADRRYLGNRRNCQFVKISKTGRNYRVARGTLFNYHSANYGLLVSVSWKQWRSFCDICCCSPNVAGGECQFERRFTSCPSEEASFILPHFLGGQDEGTKKQAQEMLPFASLHFSELLWHNQSNILSPLHAKKLEAF